MFNPHGHLTFKGTAVAAALCLISGVQASSLLYGLDFNQLGSNQNFINLGSGSTAISKTTGYINWSNSITPMTDGGYSHCPNGGTFNITSTNGIDGLNFATGFSVGIHMYYSSSSADWKDAFSMTIAGTTIRVEMTAANKWVIYNGGISGIPDGTELFAASDDTWNYLGLTFKGNEMQVYHDGELVKTVTTSLSGDSKVTSIKGSGDHNPGANGLFVDNLFPWNGSLIYKRSGPWSAGRGESAPCPVNGFLFFRSKAPGKPFPHAQPVFGNAPGMERLNGGVGELPGGDGHHHIQDFSGPGRHSGQYRCNGGGKLRTFVQNIQQPSAAQVRGNGFRSGQQVREAFGRKFFWRWRPDKGANRMSPRLIRASSAGAMLAWPGSGFAQMMSASPAIPGKRSSGLGEASV